MAKKSEKVLVKDLDTALSQRPDKVEVNWNGKIMTVKQYIDFTDFIKLVQIAADSCFSEDGYYLPQNKDYIMRVALLSYFTDVNLPENNEKRYRHVYDTDIFDKFMENANQIAIRRVIITVDEIINERVRATHSSATALNLIFKALNSITEIFDGVSKEDIDNFIKKENETELKA